ncbi:MAG: hypothetical protein KDJ25_00505 [Rhodoblastus sp.]|nr:hypothetical protein [Rhodoblastus sp.]
MASKIVTAQFLRAAVSAAMRPAGPAPMIAIRGFDAIANNHVAWANDRAGCAALCIVVMQHARLATSHPARQLARFTRDNRK